MKHDLNGSGIYKHEVPEPEPKVTHPKKKFPPIEVRAIEVDGEIYLSAKDVCINLQRASQCYPTSLSVLNFVKCFVMNLIQLETEDEK